MVSLRCRWWLAAALAVAASPAFATSIRVTTWNLDWLTLRAAGDPALPRDVATRQAGDFDRLAGYASRLHADLVAIEEVDGEAPAARLFPPDRYRILMTGDDVVQRVGLVVRRGIVVTRHPDVTALDVEPTARHRLRSGLDATLTMGGNSLRVLAVHLKTGCWSAEEDEEHRRACRPLSRQVPVLQAWITARAREGVAFLVLGDFNRRLDLPGDQMMAALDAAAPLASATAGRSSPCWDGEDFIDHILAGGPARSWLAADSLRVMTYAGADDGMKDKLSDHCPVSARLDLPGG